ncbi:MAG: hypothetical protein JF616_00230 [Fibrobacteres bacterium]|nr:hypothetical protein [Fibrobacterota bacterium]
MKTTIRSGLPLAAASLFAAAQLWAQTTGVHPGFTLQTLRPTGFNPQVGAMDFLSDGRLVMGSWTGFGKTTSSIYLISNVTTGDASKVTVATYATGLNEVLGLKVVDDHIYVMEKHRLIYLPDSNKDGKADAPIQIGPTLTIQNDAQNLEFALGLIYKDSTFYTGLATRWPYDGFEANERGCIIRYPAKMIRKPAVTDSFDLFACGMRTPNGLFWGPDGEMFNIDNSGNWVPRCDLLHMQQGHFYGVRKSNPTPMPFTNAGYTQPLMWMDKGRIIYDSPAQPVLMTTGIFKGQVLVGDPTSGNLFRLFLEKVNGEYQGALLRFTGGLEAGVNRIVIGPDGAYYLGGIGTDQWTGWGWNGHNYGLQRLTPNGKSFFDMLAVRSMGPTTMEIEFTSPVDPVSAGTTANYALKTYNYTPQAAYEGGKSSETNLAVTAATVSADKMKVTLTVTGMKAKYVIYMKLSNIKSANNESLWSNETEYTQNDFGPGTPVVVTGVEPSSHRPAKAPGFSSRSGADGRWSIAVEEVGAFSLEILDLKGRVLENKKGFGPAEFTTQGAYGSGLVLARMRGPEGVVSSHILCSSIKP